MKQRFPELTRPGTFERVGEDVAGDDDDRGHPRAFSLSLREKDSPFIFHTV